MTTKTRIDAGEALFSALIAGLGIFIGIENAMAAATSGNVAVGPKVFPYLIAAGLVGVGIAGLTGALVRMARPERDQLDWKPVGLIAVALLVQMALIPVLGWIPAAATLFVLGARAFSSRSLAADIAIGIGLGVATIVIFNVALGLNLPWGALVDAMLAE